MLINLLHEFDKYFFILCISRYTDVKSLHDLGGSIFTLVSNIDKSIDDSDQPGVEINEWKYITV